MVILQVVNTCFFMNQDCKPVLHFTFGMMLASVVAFLMHPLLWIQAGPYFDWSFLWVGVLYIFVYGAVGMFIRWKWWRYTWKKQAIIVLFIVNTILAIALLIDLYWPRYIEIDGVRERWYMDGLTGMMILSTSAVAALFSAIPISLCCYWFKRNRE